MNKYINADDFLLQYSILTSRPEFMPFSAEMSTWELWKQEFDRSVQLLVSRMITEQENDEQKVVAKIKEVPIAQVVEVKHGKWIDGHCSECRCDIPAYIDDWQWKKDINAKYCPNCGACMREGNTNG